MGRLIGEARRRLLHNELFAEGANASSAALAAFILLLLLGTEIMKWSVLLVVPLAAAAIGAWRIRQRVLSPYRIAQLVDQRFALADALSTALYFREVSPTANVNNDVRLAQYERAEQVAQTVDVRQAVPYRVPRAAYLMAALLLVASSLFALRYGIMRTLDLKQPIANFLPDALTPSKKVEQANNNRRPKQKQAPETPDDSGVNTDPEQKGEQPQQDQNQAETPGEANSEAAPNMNAKSPGSKEMKDQPDTQMATDDQDPGEQDGSKSSDNQDGQQGDNKSGQQQQDQKGQQGKQQEANQTESSSLMDKMKDAFQNLLSKVKPQQSQAQSGQQQQDQKGQQGKSQQGSKQQNSKDGQQQNAGQQGESQEGENGEQAKSDENAQQQKGQGKSDSQQTTKQPGSGVGSQDGEKAIKNAEQLQAMGKLTELMGKRAQTITGEATVEVQNTQQQLKTNYVNRGAQHTQAGAEINRDEVPVALQPYVQQYFEQVRKQTGTMPPAAAQTAAPASNSKK